MSERNPIAATVGGVPHYVCDTDDWHSTAEDLDGAKGEAQAHLRLSHPECAAGGRGGVEEALREELLHQRGIWEGQLAPIHTSREQVVAASEIKRIDKAPAARPAPAAMSQQRGPQFTLCAETGAKAIGGQCPLHNGDRCLREFVPAIPAEAPAARVDPVVDEARVREIAKRLARFNGVHYVNLVIRANAKDVTEQGDWLIADLRYLLAVITALRASLASRVGWPDGYAEGWLEGYEQARVDHGLIVPAPRPEEG